MVLQNTGSVLPQQGGDCTWLPSIIFHTTLEKSISPQEREKEQSQMAGVALGVATFLGLVYLSSHQKTAFLMLRAHVY